MLDLWYVTQTTQGVTADDLARLHPIDVDIVGATVLIPRDGLGDPWDRFIVATARVLDLPLVTRDGQIRKTDLVDTVW